MLGITGRIMPLLRKSVMKLFGAVAGEIRKIYEKRKRAFARVNASNQRKERKPTYEYFGQTL